jgi:integrase
VTSLLNRLRHDHYFETTPDRHIKSQPILVRAAVLAVMASGARPSEVAQWTWDDCKWTDSFVEFTGLGKGKRKLQRYRLFRFTRTPQLCPVVAMREALDYQAAKAEQDASSQTGPVRTDASGKSWSACHISNAIVCNLRSTGMSDEHP